MQHVVDMTLWENYRNVCFIAPFAPPPWPAYAIVTAWNPASRWVGMRRNARRQRALSRQLADALGRQLTRIGTDQRAVCAIDGYRQPGDWRLLLNRLDQRLAHAPCSAHHSYTSHA